MRLKHNSGPGFLQKAHPQRTENVTLSQLMALVDKVDTEDKLVDVAGVVDSRDCIGYVVPRIYNLLRYIADLDDRDRLHNLYSQIPTTWTNTKQFLVEHGQVQYNRVDGEVVTNESQNTYFKEYATYEREEIVGGPWMGPGGWRVAGNRKRKRLELNKSREWIEVPTPDDRPDAPECPPLVAADRGD
jgi:hypothetical protein